jgi:hypothetical protein
MTKLKFQIGHQVPGRIRLKLPAGKQNPELLEQIKTTFEAIPGIEEVTVNPTTGSIVLNYDVHQDHHVHHHLSRESPEYAAEVRSRPKTEIDELADHIQNEAEYLAEHSQTAKAVVDLFKDLDRQIKISTKNTVDLKIVLAIGIIGLTIIEVGATAATPVWVTIAVFGLNHLVQMHPGGAGDRPAARATARA